MEVYTLQMPLDPELRARILLEDERDQLSARYDAIKKRAVHFTYRSVAASIVVIFFYVYLLDYTLLEATALWTFAIVAGELLTNEKGRRKSPYWLHREMKEIRTRIKQLNGALKAVATNNNHARS